MTDAQIRALLRAKVKDFGNQAKFARSVGVSPQYLSDVINGHRTAGKRLLKAIGYELVRDFRAIA